MTGRITLDRYEIERAIRAWILDKHGLRAVASVDWKYAPDGPINAPASASTSVTDPAVPAAAAGKGEGDA
jgi:hypothetical protein